MKSSSRFSNKAKIISNKKVAPNHYRITLKLNRTVKPGQFFNVRCSNELNPLLRRPFSIHRIRPKGIIEILYKVVGEATRALSKKKKGDILDIIGPLGNGFEIKSPAILVGGGHGVAPLSALAEKMKKPKNCVALIGAKTKNEVVCEADFKKLGFKVSIATEDASKGKKGLVTDVLVDTLLPTTYPLRPTIYCCGPNAMLKEIAKIAKKDKIDAYGSFEEHMACGVGSCYGCAIKTKSGYKRVCKDGPVFNLREIEW